MKNKALSAGQVLLMAVAAGVSVANIYYNQPILNDIAVSLHMNEAEAGSIAVLIAGRLWLGLIFLIPLGDKLNRKKMVLGLLSVLVLFLLLTTFATVHGKYRPQVCSLVFIGISADYFTNGSNVQQRQPRQNIRYYIQWYFNRCFGGAGIQRLYSTLVSWRYVYGISASLVLIIDLLIYFFLPNVKVEFEVIICS